MTATFRRVVPSSTVFPISEARSIALANPPVLHCAHVPGDPIHKTVGYTPLTPGLHGGPCSAGDRPSPETARVPIQLDRRWYRGAVDPETLSRSRGGRTCEVGPVAA